ncbi:MAG: glutathione S-transferase family protein [Proteobacteria bacterium]|nr:glutathione S-transferase family protein [Pseudomonadota bacterium]
MLNLFIGTVSTCSLASHIALEEAGADYTVTRLDFSKNEQKAAAFLKVNPKARVPALVTDKGTITETPAILFYIGQVFPKANLLPADPFGMADMQAFNSYLCSTVHPAHAHKGRGHRWSDDPAVIEALKIKVPQNMNDYFGLIENGYLKGPWVMGEQFTVADAYLYVISTWLEGDGADISRLPRVIDHRSRMAARPAVQKVRASYT